MNDNRAVIKVFGVGGGGCNAINYMLGSRREGVHFYALNTDVQSLKQSQCQNENLLQLGESLTKGLGAGANPKVGRESAEADRERIKHLLEGANMAFVSAGMGGGTGTGAAPVVAEVAKEMGILTVGVVTTPFGFEGRERNRKAEEGIAELSKHVDTLIVIPNEKLLRTKSTSLTVIEAFATVDEVLNTAVASVSDLILSDGYVNIDFADIQAVMTNGGRAMMGCGSAEGEDRANKALMEAISSPLLDDIEIKEAKGVIVSINSGPDLQLDEWALIGERVSEFAAQDANVIIGSSFNEDHSDLLSISIIATNLSEKPDTTVPKGLGSQTRISAQPSARSSQRSSTPPAPNMPSFLRQQAD